MFKYSDYHYQTIKHSRPTPCWQRLFLLQRHPFFYDRCVGRSFSIVDYKVQQTEFFLSKIPECGFDLFSAQCFADAFASAARTITFSMQSVCGEINGFEPWYKERQQVLKADPLARFFHRYRTGSIHVGDTVVRGGATYVDAEGKRRVRYFFIEVPDIPDPPAEDVYASCSAFFVTLLRLVLDAYKAFPFQIDDRWYFTRENFERLKKPIEDAEIELGFPKGWTSGIGDVEERWRLLRRNHTSGCQIQEILEAYLGEGFPGPDDSVHRSACPRDGGQI